jgi:hypothetical protein
MKDFNIAELFQVYGGLLTENQREITSLYYECDLSFGEIAEQKGISRQGINDTLNKVKTQLEHFENKLNFLEKKTKIKELLENSPLKEKIEKILEEN